ncbi:ABC transporter permease [Prochlorococcus sp. MIT 1223]|uniref:ABC transporter permease n=1 Tax=Prochlorococcus sp. MIT 1223 TaxID=3096217 RepID=UPI002A74C0CF|nr:ABC-2 family transporter protein [Prochlorococcus sp. MIT 1223]
MKRYFKTLFIFWSNSIAVQLEYKINFFIEFVSMFGTLLGSIFILSLFFMNNNQLGEWTWESALVIQGVYTFLDGITNTWLRPNLTEIVNHVREGTLDFVLVKPIDSQFWISNRTISPSGIPEMLLGIIIIVWSVTRTSNSFNPGLLLPSIIMVLAGVVILYSLWFLVAATSIWFVKTWNATEVLRAVLSAGRFPVSAYPNTLRIIFTLIIPISFLTTVPANTILGSIQPLTILLGISISIIFFLISRYFWLFALRYYTSASS